MSNQRISQRISLAPVPDPNSVHAAMARAEAKRTVERTKALNLWRQGFDTKDISSRVNRPESWVYNTLAKLRERAKSEASA